VVDVAESKGAPFYFGRATCDGHDRQWVPPALPSLVSAALATAVPRQGGATMGIALRSVMVMALALFGSVGALQPATGIDGTPCTFDFVIVLDPGLSMEGSTGRHFSDGLGTIDCDGPVNGHPATGSGTLGEDGPYGTEDPDSCMAGGEGTGIDYLTIPTANGPQKIASEFTVTFGKLSNEGGLFHGEFTGSRFNGTFEFRALEGDCVTSPVTKAAVRGQGVIHS
jgi:hypothetical protein